MQIDSAKSFHPSSEYNVKSLSRVQLFATLWTVAHQAPVSMGFFRQEILEWVVIFFYKYVCEYL